MTTIYTVNFREDFIFAKIKPSRNGEITMLFTDVGKPCMSREFLKWQICLLTLFTKIKFWKKFPNLQYPNQPDTFNPCSAEPKYILF